jgi:hypothetical protein
MARSPAVEPVRKFDLVSMNFTVAAIRARLNQLDTAVDSAAAAAKSVQGVRDITTLTGNLNQLTQVVNTLAQQVSALQAATGSSGATTINFMAFDAPEPEDAFFGM